MEYLAESAVNQFIAGILCDILPMSLLSIRTEVPDILNIFMGSCICFAKHAEPIDLQYKYTDFIPDKQIIRLLFESDKQVLTINCLTF